jgi:hypothetical protein
MNYTRGVLYTLGQPVFHTGLRAEYAFTDQVSATAIAVNGWDRTIDNNAGKSFGLQLAVTVPRSGSDGDLLGAYLGYLGGPEQVDYYEADCQEGTYDPATNTCAVENDGSPTFPVDRGNGNTEGLRHLIDLVVTLTPTDALSLVLNGDYAVENYFEDFIDRRVFRSVSWYGVALGARYQIDDVFAVAGRGEYFGDPDAFRCGDTCTELGYDSFKLLTGTITGEAAPSRHLVLRLEARLDSSLTSDGTRPEVFPILRTREPTQMTTTLGVVVTTE